MNAAYVLVQNSYADWEPASALAELRRTFGYPIKVIGLTAEPVESMGGVTVLPHLVLSEFEPEGASILILPGGDSWMTGEVPEVSKAVSAMASLNRPVAAICAATLALAHCGLLEEHLHTSNGATFIGEHVQKYRGQQYYRAAPAVRDRSIITANGVSPFAFAAEIFRALAPEREEDIAMYEQLFVRGVVD